jgi:hypothetical protein
LLFHVKMKNTIILTSGLTGSSVLTGLLVRGGYWPGDRTAKKKDYDTFENADLVRLNLDLMQRADYEGSYQTRFSPETMERITSFSSQTDGEPYRALLRQSEAHSPFVWKDPRLWVTIRFWRQAVDFSGCKFLLLTRDHFQCWVSTNSRRIIQSYRHTKSYERAIEDANVAFLEENRFPYHRITYDELILKPEETITSLNRFLESSLRLEHLAAAYKGRLHQRPGSSLSGTIKAGLIYLKNYHERVDKGQPPARFIKMPAPQPGSHSPSR